MLKKIAIGMTGGLITAGALFAKAFGSTHEYNHQDNHQARDDIQRVGQNFFQSFRESNPALLLGMLMPTVRLLARIFFPGFLIERLFATSSNRSRRPTRYIYSYPGTRSYPLYSSSLLGDLQYAYTPAYGASNTTYFSPISEQNTLEKRLERIHFNDDNAPEAYKDPITYQIMDNPVRAYYKLENETEERIYICDKSTIRQLRGQCPTNRQPFIRIEDANDLKAEITNFVIAEENKVKFSGGLSATQEHR